MGKPPLQEGAIRPKNFTLTAPQVHRCAAVVLQDHLKLGDHGPKCRASLLFTLLLYAAARITSLSDACKALRDAPSDEAARLALITTLPNFAELQRRLNAALADSLPRTLRRSPQRMAADLVVIPYHGQPQHDPDKIYRSEAKSGTSHFHAYATLYVIRNGYRFTVALTPVSRGEPLEAVLKRLLHQAAQVGIRCRLLLLDRGFYKCGGDPLSPGGPPSVPDACDLPRPPARRSARTERDQCLLDLAEQRLRDLHLAQCPEAAGPCRDLCQMPLLSWSMASAWQATPDLRLLGTSASILRLGPGDVSPARRPIDSCIRPGFGPRHAIRRCGCSTWGSP